LNIFYDKTKSTWKSAFEIIRNPSPRIKEIRYISKRLSRAVDTIKVFKSENTVRTLAYMLAENNAFSGDPNFYWFEAKEQLKIRIIGLSLSINLDETYLCDLRFQERQIRS
jgi:transposase-like protein